MKNFEAVLIFLAHLVLIGTLAFAVTWLWFNIPFMDLPLPNMSEAAKTMMFCDNEDADSDFGLSTQAEPSIVLSGDDLESEEITVDADDVQFLFDTSIDTGGKIYMKINYPNGGGHFNPLPKDEYKVEIIGQDGSRFTIPFKKGKDPIIINFKEINTRREE